MKLASLFRPGLAAAAGISAATGAFALPGGAFLVPAAASFVGVSLLAAGSSALNQAIERDLDRLMERTRHRPVAAGSLSRAAATLLGAALLGAGAGILAVAGGAAAARVALAAVAWYLLIYTPLKTRTSLALPIGAVCGAVPPIVGWCAAGGNPADHRGLLLAGLLYLWQIPHFWLVRSRHIDDYRRAGIPVVSWAGGGHFRLWLIALASAMLLLPAIGMVPHYPALWYPGLFVPAAALFALRSPRIARLFQAFPVLLALLVAACA